MSCGDVMPMYEFKCEYCDSRREVTAHYDEEIIAPICCNQGMARYWSVPGISFKGSGFYTNDKNSK